MRIGHVTDDLPSPVRITPALQDEARLAARENRLVPTRKAAPSLCLRTACWFSITSASSSPGDGHPLSSPVSTLPDAILPSGRSRLQALCEQADPPHPRDPCKADHPCPDYRSASFTRLVNRPHQVKMWLFPSTSTQLLLQTRRPCRQKSTRLPFYWATPGPQMPAAVALSTAIMTDLLTQARGTSKPCFRISALRTKFSGVNVSHRALTKTASDTGCCKTRHVNKPPVKGSRRKSAAEGDVGVLGHRLSASQSTRQNSEPDILYQPEGTSGRNLW